MLLKPGGMLRITRITAATGVDDDYVMPMVKGELVQLLYPSRLVVKVSDGSHVEVPIDAVEIVHETR